MRGADTFTESLFTMRHLDDFVPADHPLRVIRMMVNKALASMNELFAQMYAADIKGGRPSIAPEKLLRAWTKKTRDTRRWSSCTSVASRWCGYTSEAPRL
jgi:transposase